MSARSGAPPGKRERPSGTAGAHSRSSQAADEPRATVTHLDDIRALHAWRAAVDHIGVYGIDVVWALPEHVRRAGRRRGWWR